MSISGEWGKFLRRENDLQADDAKIGIMSKIVVYIQLLKNFAGGKLIDSNFSP